MATVKWVIGGQNGSSVAQLLYSTDGKTYTDSSNASTIFGSTSGSNIYGVANNGSIWVAGGNATNSAYPIGYSYDGIVWYGSSSGKSILSSIGGVCYGNGKFVAGGGGATYNAMYSTDGINWNAGNLLATTWSNYTQHVGFANSTFVMCGGGGKIAFSSDGINWQLSSASGLGQETNMIDYGAGLWAVAGSGTNANMCSTSTLTTSATWTTRAGSVYSNRATGVKYGGDKFVAIGRPETYFYTSTDGISWSQNTNSSSLFLNSQIYARNKIEWYNGLWIIGQYTFGSSSSALWSNDGITWNTCTVPANSSWIRGIGYARSFNAATTNIKYLVCGTYSGVGSVAYSTDGVNYSTYSLAGTQVNNVVSAIINGQIVWVAAVSGGTPTFGLMYSYNGSTWNYGTPGTGASFTTADMVSYGNGVFLANMGSNNKILQSTDGVNWTLYSVAYYGPGTVTSTFIIKYVNSRWYISYLTSTVIENGSNYHTKYSTDLVTWNMVVGNFTTTLLYYNVTGYIGISGWTAYYSADGINWSTAITLTSSDSYWSIGAGGTTFLASSGTKLYSSTNGTTWNNITGTNYFGVIRSINYSTVNSTYVLYTNSGISYYSTDLVNWTISYINNGFAPITSSSIFGTTLGTAPTINSITPAGQSVLSVNFTAGTGGNPAPTTYYYSLDGGSTYTNANSATSPLNISVNSGVNYQVALIANSLAGNTVASNVVVGFIPYPCFLQGTKILRMNQETDEEEYVPVESLHRGDLIRTASHGYKAIELIGSREIANPLDILKKSSKLYWFRKSKVAGLREDLCVTGDHCILHKSISTAKKDQVFEYMGDIYVTEEHYRVPAFLDDRAEPYVDSATVTIWHFALENPNIYHNYGVMANGLLVESSSLHYMYKHSNMRMI